MSTDTVRHFLDLIDIPKPVLASLIEKSRAMKAARARGEASAPLAGKTLAMIFDKPSTRTRVSFDVAMRQLGGEAIVLTAQEMLRGGAMPSREKIREQISGNYCRCTGYHAIVDAIEAVAQGRGKRGAPTGQQPLVPAKAGTQLFRALDRQQDRANWNSNARSFPASTLDSIF